MSRPGRWARYRKEAREMRPVEEADGGGLRTAWATAQSIGSFAVLDLNDWLIARFGGDLAPVRSSRDWPWMAGVEARTPEIRAELEAYLARTTLPHVAAMSGLDPESEEGKVSVPGIKGTWRTVVLFANGRWIPETADHFPLTRSLFEDLHPKSNVGFSALEAHSHIEAHVGPNRGALRFQLPIIVPGEPGDCRIRVGEEMLVWAEGEAVVFDLKTDHEAWNDADALRVLLMVEIEMPLRQPLRAFNRLAQYSYRWHPSYRQMPQRVARLGAAAEVPT